MKSFAERLTVKAGTKVRLADVDTAETCGLEKPEAENLLEQIRQELLELQAVLYAEARRAVLIVLQGMDASGKDGTIRNVARGLNPQGVTVTSFKAPEGEEKRRDYLWRIHRAVPEWGKIGIFNRSHYEDVLVVRVRNLAPREVWSRRFDHINDFERMLADNNVRILKFYLAISKEEQAKRFAARRTDPTKIWKLAPSDTKDRELWDDYMSAYEDVLTKCNTPAAPWHVIPADRKWFRNVAVAQILRDELKAMKLEYPRAPA